MARNRIIHNVQDVFVGSSPSETDRLVTGIAGHQILKRIDRVQSFSYSIDLPKKEALTLGKSKPFSRSSSLPPKVGLSFSCYMNGVNNEKRLGLSTNNENENANDQDKCIFHDLLMSSEVGDQEDKRNLYLIINSSDEDVHGYGTIPHEELINGTFTEEDVIHEKSPSHSVVVFQNCYLNSYNIKASVGAIPTADFDYIADSIVGYASGSGIEIPTLHIQSGIVTGDGTKFIIPRHLDKKNAPAEDNFLSHGGNINVSISSDSGGDGVENFLDDNITSCSINCSLDRDEIGYVGNKLISNRWIKVPMKAELSIETQVKENVSGSFLDNMKENKDYNIVLDFEHNPETIGNIDKSAIKYTFSGAKFEGVSYSDSIGANKTASMKFTTYMDLEADRSSGAFLSGKISAVFGEVVTENGDEVIDNNSNDVISMPVYPQY